MINATIKDYNAAQPQAEKAICELLSMEIDKALLDAENKIWHGSPVWFLEDNPIVGYAVRKNNVQLLFWSGQSFDEPGLSPEGSFKAAELRIISPDQIVIEDLERWLDKAKTIQWDYKNIVKRRGVLERLK